MEKYNFYSTIDDNGNINYSCLFERNNHKYNRSGKTSILSLIKMLDADKYYDVYFSDSIGNEHKFKDDNEVDLNRTLVLKNKNRKIIMHDFDEYQRLTSNDELDFSKYSAFRNNKDKIINAINVYNKESKVYEKKTNAIKKLKITAFSLSLFAVAAGLVLVHERNSKPINISHIEEENDETEYDEEYPQEENGITNIIYEETNNTIENFSVIDDTDNPEFTQTKQKYESIAKEVGEKYGVSPELILAMITQESRGKIDNLMQIQFSSWKDELLSSYNFTNGILEKYVLTDNPENYDESVTTISRDDLNNPYINVLVGTLCLRKTAANFNYNLPLSIQAYNLGTTNMYKVLETTSYYTNKTIDEIKNNPLDVSYMDYTNVVNVGDSNYLKNILKFVESNSINIKSVERNNVVVDHKVEFSKEKQKSL